MSEDGWRGFLDAEGTHRKIWCAQLYASRYALITPRHRDGSNCRDCIVACYPLATVTAARMHPSISPPSRLGSGDSRTQTHYG